MYVRMNPTREDIRRMSRRYHYLYINEGCSAFEAMEQTLVEAKVPTDEKPRISELVRNYSSTTVNSARELRAPVHNKRTFRERLSYVNNTYADASLPTGSK